MSQKSYDGTPTLYIVPTPIGNLGDITFRAIEVLKNVDVIFSEDTRVTLQLLNYLKINKKLVSSHKFNESASKNKMIEYLNAGKNIALVTDRGTPIISDPGSLCTVSAIEEGYNVVSLPGATALIPSLTSSGLDCSRFFFYGFLNSKSSKRKKELLDLKLFKNTIVFYEAPHRIIEMLTDSLEIFGDRRISVSREISKKFEEIYRGNISSIIPLLVDAKGEFVIVVEGNNKLDNFNELSIKEHYDMYIDKGLTEKEAIKLVAKEKNLVKNDVYKEVKLFPGK